MRIPVPAARLVTAALTVLLLSACAAQTPPSAEPAPAQPEAAAAPAAMSMSPAEVLAGLNALVNDTEPGSDADCALRARLAQAKDAPDLAPALRRALDQALDFDPPRLRQRWQAHNAAQENAAALYAANPPQNTDALNGARVLRRLGPALYLVRLPAGETVLLASTRRHKAKEKLVKLAAQERPRPKPDRDKGDLVDELEDQPRTFVEITRQDARRMEAGRAPVLARLRGLEAESDEVLRAVAQDIARLDVLSREVNAVIGPMLLTRGPAPAPARFIRKVTRMGKTYSRQQYYRYALPVTGSPSQDAVLKGFLDERRAEVQELIKSTGVGKGRLRTNVDRIVFSAFAASPRLFSIRFEEFRDTGGAHPNQAFAAFSFDLKRQGKLSLSDVFNDEKAALKILSELAARRMELVLDGSVFPEGLAPTPENFAVFVLDGADMVFTFPPYQVASYAQGAQTLRVPLHHPRLLPLLQPGFKEALAASN